MCAKECKMKTKFQDIIILVIVLHSFFLIISLKYNKCEKITWET
jgi:hypothetical protein